MILQFVLQTLDKISEYNMAPFEANWVYLLCKAVGESSSNIDLCQFFKFSGLSLWSFHMLLHHVITDSKSENRSERGKKVFFGPWQ